MHATGLAGRFALAAAMMLAATAPAWAAVVTLTGEITYRERIALPADASLRIRLVDMTARGNPTRVEVEAPVATPGQPPLTFTLNFDDRAIDRTHRHALVTEISAGRQLWFRNAEPYGLDPLAPAEPIRIVTSFVGRIATAGDSGAVPQASTAATLLETTWQAETIGGNAVVEGIASTLTISADMRAGGRGGCNSYLAQVALNGSAIRFSAVGATRMACMSVAATQQETTFFNALAAAQSFRIEADTLILFDAGDVEVVRFVRQSR